MKNEYNIATKKGFEEKDLEDILIISEIKKGDTKAFGKIYDKYYNEILIKMTYLYNGNVEKAKDLTSEVMIKVNEVLHKYSVENGSGKFGGWINKIAKNTFIDKPRTTKNKFSKKLIHIDKDFDLGENSVHIQIKDYRDNPEENIINKETKKENNQSLKLAIDKLDEIEKTLINLRYYSGLSYKEISKKTGETENFCRVKMKRTLEKMKKIII